MKTIEVSTGALRTLQAIVAIVTVVYVIHLIYKERRIRKSIALNGASQVDSYSGSDHLVV